MAACLEDRSGMFWVATHGSLCQFSSPVAARDREPRRFTTDDGLPGTTILSLAEDSDGGILVDLPIQPPTAISL